MELPGEPRILLRSIGLRLLVDFFSENGLTLGRMSQMGPFSARHGAGPEFRGTLTHAHGTLSGLLWRPRTIEQAYGLPADRPAAGRPGRETTDGGAGEGAAAARTRCANRLRFMSPRRDRCTECVSFDNELVRGH
jgi:hypothetical protein